MKLSHLYKGCPGMGGRLGGSIVFVHGIRVPSPSTSRRSALWRPSPTRKKKKLRPRPKPRRRR